MNLDEYRALFLVATLGLSLVSVSPVLSALVPVGAGSEKFSEMWLLGPGHMDEGFPFNVGVNETYSVFVGMSNHMGVSEYCVIYVKFRNGTQPLPDINSSRPSLLPAFYEYRFFVGAGEVWESLLTFAFQDVHVQGNFSSVGAILINGVAFPVDSIALWDSENSGFFYQLFFELWFYDLPSRDFRFHNRYVGIWLNITG